MKHSNIAFFIPHKGCPHRCSFCDQRTISGTQQVPTPKEVTDSCRQALSECRSPENTEIAFFGGSFTAIPTREMVEYLEAAAPFVGKGGFAGIRVSTRPDAVEAPVLKILRQYGVMSVELGAQSMDDTVLALNKRGHTAEDVRQGAERVRQYGFSLGLQMMTGLVGDSKESAYRTAREFIRLSPNGVRIYPTVVLPGTELAALVREGVYHPPGLEETVSLCAGLLNLFDGAGIPVIRLGLHASQEVGERMIAGAYHPALRELCEARRYLERMERLLAEVPPGEYRLCVSARCLSQALGQKKENIARLRERGYEISVAPDERLKPLEVRFLQGKEVTGCF